VVGKGCADGTRSDELPTSKWSRLTSVINVSRDQSAKLPRSGAKEQYVGRLSPSYCRSGTSESITSVSPHPTPARNCSAALCLRTGWGVGPQ
jgi:hypothetical protein